VFQLPVWTPGSYRLRDFPQRVRDVRAALPGGEELPVTQLDGHTWEVRHGDQPSLELRYRVELADDDRFMMRGELRRCITYEGPQVYMYLRGHVDAPCAVRFELPDGWSVGSGLVDAGNGEYFAQDYDFLADCPVKLGVFQRFGFASHGVPIDVIVDGPGDVEFDHAAWLSNLKKITDAQGEIFGGFPFDRYAFLFTASPRGGGGGLEHLTSTAIGLSVSRLREDPTEGMGVTAHEFFHLWNVKRLRPRALGPFDYTRENRTTMLWLCEGVTSYYTDVTLLRCGLRTAKQFWESMAREIGSLESSPARRHVSSAMASYGAWDDAPADRRLDYYNSGQVLGLLLDLQIRERTRNRRSLDDVMRAMYRLCADRGRGFDDEELVTAVGDAADADFAPWFDRYVYGTVTPPYGEILGHAGLRYAEEVSGAKAVRGVRALGRGEGAPYYVAPETGSQLTRSGRLLKLGDAAVADMASVEAAVAGLEPGAVVRLEIERLGGGTRAVRTAVVETRRVRVSLEEDPDAGALQRAIREGIATGTPGRPGK
jgi:predicted metalloprotease with PDZ domain